MANITNANGFRSMEATLVAGLYFFCTLHGTGGSALTSATTVYANTGLGELATGNGYTLGGIAIGQGTVSGTYNVAVPGNQAQWTASGGNIGPVSYCALWCNTTNTITGAKLIEVTDTSATPQTASSGQTMTAAITNPIQY